jgi:DNA-binding NtrC family response regulator
LKKPNNIRIYIVEDDNIQSQILLDKLLEFNPDYNIIQFNSGEQLLEYFSTSYKRTRCHYVILDYFLQTQDNQDALNGFEIINILEEKHPKVNVILYSAYESDNSSNFDKLTKKFNVLDFVKKTPYSFLNIQNLIRFNSARLILQKKKKRFIWAFSLLGIIVTIAVVYYIFGIYLSK